MQRKASFRSLLSPFHRQVASTVAMLRQDIVRREKELAELKTEVAGWKRVVSEQAGISRSFRTPPLSVSAATRSRVNWSAMLKQLPVRFTPQDVAEKTGRPLPQVYTGLYRWMKERKIRKGKHGYQKVSSAASR